MIDFFSRLDIYMKYKGLNDNKITVEAGISNGLIGKGRKRGSLSQDNISKILCTYSDLSADWLLTGKGDMIAQPNEAPPSASALEERLLAIIKEKDIKIEEQAKIIGRLEERVETLSKKSIGTTDAGGAICAAANE